MINKDTARHYLWGEGCDGWDLLMAEGLNIIQERMPPGTSEVRHYHQSARQFFFVLSGTVTVEINGQREVLQQHQGIEVLPGIPHQVFNESENDVEFLLIAHPPSRGDRVLLD
jgi:mannose-6-phosphate isomerase-like protein (cupin superfamily)